MVVYLLLRDFEVFLLISEPVNILHLDLYKSLSLHISYADLVGNIIAIRIPDALCSFLAASCLGCLASRSSSSYQGQEQMNSETQEPF